MTSALIQETRSHFTSINHRSARDGLDFIGTSASVLATGWKESLS